MYLCIQRKCALFSHAIGLPCRSLQLRHRPLHFRKAFFRPNREPTVDDALPRNSPPSPSTKLISAFCLNSGFRAEASVIFSVRLLCFCLLLPSKIHGVVRIFSHDHDMSPAKVFLPPMGFSHAFSFRLRGRFHSSILHPNF